jgi:hypothetical protein
MTEPLDQPTPDFSALRDTRPEDDGPTGDQLASDQGPGTASENSVDEELGRGEA